MIYTRDDLKTMQCWSLERKIQVTQTRIMEWYYHFNGKVYVSFSGGKDSTILLDLARRAFPDIPALFVDTGLDYPELREFVKTFDNVEWIKPAMNFNQVIKKYGYPIIGKEVAKKTYYFRKGSQHAIDCFNGVNPDGSPSKFRQRYIKYRFLLDANFPISHYCCEIMKIQPCRRYETQTKNMPIVATMACESQQREAGWLKTGCNAFKDKKSKPMSFWTEQDVLRYLKITNIPYCNIYGNIEPVVGQLDLFGNEGKLHTTGLKRTGCMFCMFGVHLEKEPNRFQRMKITHPQLYDYCINNLGCGKVMDYIGVKY